MIKERDLTESDKKAIKKKEFRERQKGEERGKKNH